MSEQSSSPQSDLEEPSERRRTSPVKRALRATLLAELQEDIASRLRVVCAHLPQEEFDQLVLDMARMRMRFWDLEQDVNLQGHYEPEEE